MKKDELIELILKHGGDEGTSDRSSTTAQPSKNKKKGAPKKSEGPLDKSAIKQLIRTLKQEKKDAISQQDGAKASQCNRQIHDYKRQLRKMAGTKKKKKKQG